MMVAIQLQSIVSPGFPSRTPSQCLKEHFSTRHGYFFTYHSFRTGAFEQIAETRGLSARTAKRVLNDAIFLEKKTKISKEETRFRASNAAQPKSSYSSTTGHFLGSYTKSTTGDRVRGPD